MKVIDFVKLFGRDRRRHPRFAVSWEACLQCEGHGFSERLPVDVLDISLAGSRLRLQSMQAGTRHLVIGEAPLGLRLEIPLPEATFSTHVEIRWYDRIVGESAFAAGVEFVGMEDRTRVFLEKTVRILQRRDGVPLP